MSVPTVGSKASRFADTETVLRTVQHLPNLQRNR